MKNLLISLSVVAVTLSIVSKPVMAVNNDGVIINVDPETCVKRGGRPLTETKCRLAPIDSLVLLTYLEDMLKAEKKDCKLNPHRGCRRRES